MKSEWDVFCFEDCFERIKISKKIPKKLFNPVGKYPIISQEEELINGYWDIEEDLLKVERPLVIFGDHTKKIKYIDFDFVLGADGVKVLLPKAFLDARFLYYQLQSIPIEDLGYARHYRLLKQTKILCPPLPEQHQIVSILDKAFAAIDKAKANIEKNIQNAKELFQSKLDEVFSNKGEGWEEKKLEDLGKLTSSKRIYKNEYVKTGIPFYRSKEIKELADGKKISTELYITLERYEEIKNKFGIPNVGDILLTAVGTIGEIYIVKEKDRFYFKDGNIMWLKDFLSLNPSYLKYALTSYIDQIKALTRGSAYNALTIEKLKKYEIPVPSKQVQEKIVRDLSILKDKSRNIINIYQQKIIGLDELKKSILQQAFNGELTS